MYNHCASGKEAWSASKRMKSRHRATKASKLKSVSVPLSSISHYGGFQAIIQVNEAKADSHLEARRQNTACAIRRTDPRCAFGD